MVYIPFAVVAVPVFRSGKYTEAPSSGRPVFLSVTFPLSVLFAGSANNFFIVAFAVADIVMAAANNIIFIERIGRMVKSVKRWIEEDALIDANHAYHKR